MTNQVITNQKINNLLELASEYIECGPECQKNKKSQDLYDTYIKSQTILKMAPDKVEKNKKNYYVYTYGESYYEDIKKKEIVKNSTEIMDKILNEFNLQVENALIMNKILETTDPKDNCSDQYPIIQKELNDELYKKNNNMLINNRETYYSNESIERLEYWNKFCVFIYYFIILIFLILCFPNTKYDIIKYGIVIGFAFLYILIVNYSSLYFYSNKFKIIISIIYFIILLIIILFILYKITTTFKYILINLIDTLREIYKFSEK